MSGNPETTPDIATPSKRGTIHSEDRSLAARRTSRGMIWAIRVCADSPHRVRTLEREKRLGDIGLDERYTACFSDKRDELEDIKTSDNLLSECNDTS